MEAKTLWQKNKWILYLLVVVVIGSFVFDTCYNLEPNTTVVVPGQKGETIFIYPKNTPIEKDTILLRSTKWFENKKQNNFLQSEIDKLLQENENLKSEYETATDSLQKLLYAQAIQLNSFHETIDNDTIKIDAIGITQGKLKTLKIDWKIKSKSIEVKQKERVFYLKIGGEYGNSVELNKGLFKGNLEFNNVKIGYDTDKRIWLGYNFKIFEIKR